jgi:hypothetical protein
MAHNTVEAVVAVTDRRREGLLAPRPPENANRKTILFRIDEGRVVAMGDVLVGDLTLG